MEIDVVYTDFHKAFDKVNLDRLLLKLKLYGVRDPLLSWLKTYLIGRQQIVNVNGFLSSEFLVPSGVPQGSHLGSLLFLIYINDISNAFENCKFLLFADDVKIFRKIDTLNDTFFIQNDLDRFLKWCESNDMLLSIEKCKFIKFSKRKKPSVMSSYNINNTILEKVFVIRDLRVLIDNELTFVQHIDLIISKSKKMLGFITRITIKFKNVRSLVILYCSLVRSCLEYASNIWSPYYMTHIDRIEGVQRKFVKLLSFRSKLYFERNNYNNIICYFGLSTLQVRRVYYQLCFMYKILNYIIMCPRLLSMISINVHELLTRCPQLIQVEYHRTNYGINSPLSVLTKISNNYANKLNFFGVSLNNFKHMSKNALNM